MEIKYSYFLPLTEGTSTLDYDEFLDYVGGEDFTVEELREAVRTIAVEDLERMCANNWADFDIIISDEFIDKLMTELSSKRSAQDDAVESIRKILDAFDCGTQQRILDMI